MVQHDRNLAAGPHTVIHGITGTKGMALEYPLPPRISKDLNGWVSQKEYDALAKQFTPTIIARMGDLTKKDRAVTAAAICWNAGG